MINNERQYRITKAQAEKFREALNELETSGPQEGVHPRLVQAQRDALQSQLDEMLEEIADYESLKAGEVKAIDVNSFDDLPEALIRARIAAGLSQKDLADRLDLKEQQIQRYEADRYASASLQRIQDVAKAIGVRVSNSLLLPLKPTNFDTLVAKLDQVGLDKEFLRTKLLPTTELTNLDRSGKVPDEERLIAHTASITSRIFGWEPEELFAAPPLAAPKFAAAAARFKLPAKRKQAATSLYAAYANFLAVAVLKGSETISPQKISSDAVSFRKELLKKHDALTLHNVLQFAWDLGVPVLPLRDRGTFHGACWRYDHRNIVVLKQTSRHQSRWLFDLLHELYHASQRPELETLEVIEADENSGERRNSDEEIAASQFAGDVLLNGRAEEIAQECVNEARGAVERLKAVVPGVAKKFKVDVGSVANYLAFRLSWQNINWWGAAANLQASDDSPWELARDVFLQRFPFGLDSELDKQLLTRALQ